MGAEKTKFTKRSLEAIPLTTGGTVKYRDEGKEHLYLIVGQMKKVFYCVAKHRGRTRWVKIGTFPQVTVDEAHSRVDEFLGDFAKGRDPGAERKADRAVVTFGDLFDAYMSDYAKEHKKSWQQDEWNYNRHVRAHWRTRRVDEITPTMVTRLHNRLSETSGKVMANRILALVRGVFSWGIDHDKAKVDNPCRATKAHSEQSRERFMDGDELQRFFAALEKQKPKMRDFFNLLLETGVRKSTLMQAAWVDISLKKAEWRVRGEVEKSGRPLTVTLTDEAVAILRRRFEENRRPRTVAGGKVAEPLLSPWVFPSREQSTKAGHLSDVSRAWREITQEASLPDLHIHDIRRTLGSWMAAQNSSLLMIGRALGHHDTKATEVYARVNTDPIRQAVEQATRAMRQVAKG